MVAIHISLPCGRSLVIDKDTSVAVGLPQDADVTCGDLKDAVEALEGISADEQRLEIAGRQLGNDECAISAEEHDGGDSGILPVSILLDLCGGKGGFGSMLRAMGSQRSGHETSNVEACRDLSGRRLRHVNDEKKIAEWFRGQEQREEEARKKKTAKRERVLTQPKHTYDHHGARIELNELSEKVDEGVKAGFAAAVENRKRLLEGSAPDAKKAKVVKVRGGWDFSDESSSDDSEAPDEGDKQAEAAATAPATTAESAAEKEEPAAAEPAPAVAKKAAAAGKGKKASGKGKKASGKRKGKK